MATKPLLLIPVENQVRELDPKLLLACVAARRGFSSVIGSRREIEFNISSFPKSVYLSKSMTVHSAMLFQIASKFGHRIMAWDEEALVHLPPETYFSRRLCLASIKYVSHLFAWGQDNADLWRQYPGLPNGTPIHVTGNPRGDMLRPEMRDFFAEEVAELRKTYGDFILVNTNFNHVNAFGPSLNLFQPALMPGKKPKFGRAARGMSREYAAGLRDFKQAVFEDFKRLIPILEKSFPDFNIVVRPHPTESQEIYHKIAAQCERVKVTNEGNVVPWLLATKALVHNSCTTGLEAYVMGVPAVTYRATVNEDYDHGFYRLPNLLSHQCFDFEELRLLIEKILAGELGAADGAERQELIDYHLAGIHGPLACELMVNAIEKIVTDGSGPAKPSLRDRLDRWWMEKGLRLVKRCKYYLPGSHNRPEFQKHRYPGISREELRQRISRFQQLLGDNGEIQVEEMCEQIFRISV
jgi:surface carbohydrate biosynthesis protein